MKWTLGNKGCIMEDHLFCMKTLNERPGGKTNVVVSDQVQFKSGCTVTEDS